MSKRQIFMGAGAAVLAVAGVFAGRASTKFANATSIYVHTTLGGCNKVIVNSGTATTFTTGGGGTAATILSAGNNTRTLWATSTCSTKPVHFKSK